MGREREQKKKQIYRDRNTSWCGRPPPPRPTDMYFYQVGHGGEWFKNGPGLFGSTDCTSSCWPFISTGHVQHPISNLLLRKHLNIATGGHVANSTKRFGRSSQQRENMRNIKQRVEGQRTPSQVVYKKGLIVNRTYMRMHGHHLRKSVKCYLFSR